MADMTRMVCGECGIEYSLPAEFLNECREEGKKKTFYCPNGHARIFVKAKSEIVRENMQGVISARLTEYYEVLGSRDKHRDCAKELKRSNAALRGVITKKNKTIDALRFAYGAAK